jgi:sulfate permease, SulP family
MLGMAGPIAGRVLEDQLANVQRGGLSTGLAIRDIRPVGAAPDLEQHLREAFDEARAKNIEHFVLRVKRVRNPDAVCFERLEHVLKDAHAEGFTIVLAGIRPDLLRGIKRLGFAAWLPEERWFPEEEEQYSSTLKAVRKAYELCGLRRPQGEAVVYYLV